MKKDKKWFVDKLTKKRDRADVHDPMYYFINELIADVNQLDELEVLSAEWIEGNTSPVDDEGRLYIWKRDLENLIVPKQESGVLSQGWLDENKSSWTKLKIDSYYIPVEKLQSLLVPKQELTVVPKYVGEWITKHREKYDLYPALKELEESVWGWERTYKWYRMNTHKFVNAYLTGEYEVEEAPKYHALIKGHEVSNFYDIYWNYDKSDDGVFVSRLHPPHDNFLNEMSKEDWIKLGINDSNADFVKVNE